MSCHVIPAAMPLAASGDSLVPLAVACVLSLATALAVILPRRPVPGAIALLAHSLCLAGLYVCLQAELVAMGQVIVYSGAIVVLFLFVVLLLPKGGREGRTGPRRYLGALVAGGAFFSAMFSAVAVTLPEPLPAPHATASDVGRSMFDGLLVAFEMTAPLLLVAIIGAVTLWRRQESISP